jgi:PAS domain S-box-containing protein
VEFILDITDAKRAEAALRDSEARLARLLATTPAGVVELDAGGCFAYANAAAEGILGAGPGGLVGRRHDDPAWQATAGDGAPLAPERLPVAWVLRGEEVRDYELAVTALDGRRAVLLMDATPVRDGAGRIEGALAAFQDVTARQAAVEALRESEARLRLALDTGGLGDFEWDLRADVVRPSARAREIFAFAPGEGERSADYLARILPEDLPRALAEMEGGLAAGQVASGYRARLPDGTVRHVLSQGVVVRDADGAPLRLIGVFADETERRRAEAALRQVNETLEARVAERTAALTQAVDALHAEALERTQAEAALRQSQKMEAVGQLTGGIAHDFNNMLQGISGSLELMRRRVAQGRAEEVARYVEGASATVERAAALTNRLLAFARRQALQPRLVDPNELIRGMAELIRRTVGPGVAVDLRLGDGAWSVLCDPNQLENVLLNLAINARDAMPEGGRLTIETAGMHLTRADVAGQDGAKPGDYVKIGIADNGTGMDEATVARAFEPFFTTKPLGQGTGLGLSQIYGFVRQSGGVVRLDSAPGRGTTVCLHLPRHEQARGAEAAGPVDPAEAPQTGAGRTVLLVEDEAQVRGVAAETLRDLGYHVLEAGDGSAALRVLQDSFDSRVDLLVTDVGLPGGLNGRQMAEIARERRPGLPVLFITGYAGGALEKQLAPGMEVIAKPFSLDAFASRARGLIEAALVTAPR